ncbi:multifunctional oxoglutarate decarboxylase/oxoglutarate dehydrogenase thiamine pyrophosphate-binding subunit/dihydrolipoyllysine-residue succinyltransferase subunit [Glutamicibacter halophytocola]|uniref:Multifunctional oxoglutarate decarboxylase/oxoglutarate dehydrogenase thiamine pyrophosphate-binding subunit/dihydrolipoyllysine-residue succinyltransferase subunit n=1 Tax=Glutamicibacter halophytocola TaxID=1933880 RepID=A0A5B8IKS7_9MICC|nr:multifunctional oxoglutarate decarboxylase/oxoglutarate dehydrogenase thiamine pyrophosphate-binding subunit/dihydrolipoyllysine-residue succinyltransferase subunit [Glutamicibacter halophytocola]ALG30786.1 alpha-ketoglutarate decarboxylase [Glutamicibacter halophytocola]NQD40373.1 multifunctional oxoglutarate decarboxylase/oxoglutarate dehydrogenase thiamine pyrophosphate-binding subunit/dihydrolipoyllysine-residue succinyltransferase subunit [Glutamicibacter halophytocola]QDY64908.1 multifu
MPEQAHHRLTEEFGGNEWLVDELFEQYLVDKNSVDKKWWDIFESLAADKKAPATQPAPAAPAATTAAPATTGQGTPRAATQARASEPAPASKPAPAAAPDAEAKKAEPAPKTAPIPAQAPKATPSTELFGEEKRTPLRGPMKAIATNMDASLAVPTATTVRAVPAKVMIDNRIVINNHLKRARGGKISFTHLIGFAVIRALKQIPSMNVTYDVIDKKPTAIQPAHVNFGIAIDMPKPDGTRMLAVPNVKAAETLSFNEFWATYEDLIKRARGNKLTADDYAGTTVSLTNPGGIGTVHSVPRLSKGQAAIIGVGALEYPAEYRGSSEKTVAALGIGKHITLTSTYDHRVIQGAGSGEFLKLVESLLLGEQGFYDEIFEQLRIPYEPVRWAVDNQVDIDLQVNKVARIQHLINSYRERGHLMADINPLEYVQRKHPDLDINNYGLTLWDLDREWITGGLGGKDRALLRDILGTLRDAYCRTIGTEYMHLQNPEEREWFQSKLESRYAKPTREEQLRILSKLNSAEAFETFLQTKFVGQKRFSLEGGESLIPLLDAIISDAADDQLDEVAIGMAHRGRLNVLTNIAGKTYAQVFREFEGTATPGSVQGSGDVKYHLGTEGSYTSDAGNQTKVYLAANPSHLEAVDPVLEGITRAKLDRLGSKNEVLPILVHGDAAFAGQGVVSEVLAMSQLPGYKTGGTVHVIVNNQIGFTTAPSSSRSSVYASDVARTVQAPIFHVNGDDPEAVVHVGQLAFEYRQKFGKDVVIDLVCYRRRGHNEGDDPSMTQPIMYNLIEAKRSTRKLYTEALVGRGDITQEEAEHVLAEYKENLERIFAETHAAQTSPIPIITPGSTINDLEKPFAQAADENTIDGARGSAISAQTLAHIGAAHVQIPEGFTMHTKLKSLLERREKMSREGGIDWGFAEVAALGSLSMEGVPVRLAGQDSRRGTFVQRHSVFHDRENDNEWYPLHNLSEDQAPLWIYDSLLSEYAALGFEYGYSVERPDALVMWEAQFGDFVNGAQTVIDEFISSAEQKWSQSSSLVMLLPHGYEGQGPDHSSARIERFLQLCAENNMVVAQPSTGANHFHLLRRQAYARPRKPLIVFTPKQLLRLKAAASSVEDFTTGGFQEVIGDHTITDANAVDKVLLCSGRVYYDLVAARSKAQDSKTAIVRVEQLYPAPSEQIAAELAKYPNAKAAWVQDEPANQGPWPFFGLYVAPQLEQKITLVSRPASAATSAGNAKRHDAENAVLLQQAFAR